jgi:hypothetical protein
MLEQQPKENAEMNALSKIRADLNSSRNERDGTRNGCTVWRTYGNERANRLQIPIPKIKDLYGTGSKNQNSNSKTHIDK